MSISAETIVEGNNRMTTKIYDELRKKEVPPPRNESMYSRSQPYEACVMFSPISLHATMSMLYEAAGHETVITAFKLFLGNTSQARTADEYSKLIMSANVATDVQLQLENQVNIGCRNFNESLKKVFNQQFYACTEYVNNMKGSLDLFNYWISRHTKCNIQDLINESDLLPHTILLLINTIYFEGFWDVPFGKTANQNFYITDKTYVHLNMITQTGLFAYKKDLNLNAYVIKVPFRNKDMGMIFVLPIRLYGMFDLERRLTTYNLNNIDDGMSFQNILVNIPEFAFVSEYYLDGVLGKAGLENAFEFDDNFNARNEQREQNYLGNIKQKVSIRLDAVGVKHSGASCAQIRNFLRNDITAAISVEPQPIEPGGMRSEETFIANHPFIFMLRYKKSTLFFGKFNYKSS